jgi:hypothetical protein
MILIPHAIRGYVTSSIVPRYDDNRLTSSISSDPMPSMWTNHSHANSLHARAKSYSRSHDYPMSAGASA